MELLPNFPQDARSFKLLNQSISFMNSSSDIRQPAEKEGNRPQRESGEKREEPS